MRATSITTPHSPAVPAASIPPPPLRPRREASETAYRALIAALDAAAAIPRGQMADVADALLERVMTSDRGIAVIDLTDLEPSKHMDKHSLYRGTWLMPKAGWEALRTYMASLGCNQFKVNCRRQPSVEMFQRLQTAGFGLFGIDDPDTQDCISFDLRRSTFSAAQREPTPQDIQACERKVYKCCFPDRVRGAEALCDMRAAVRDLMGSAATVEVKSRIVDLAEHGKLRPLAMIIVATLESDASDRHKREILQERFVDSVLDELLKETDEYGRMWAIPCAHQIAQLWTSLDEPFMLRPIHTPQQNPEPRVVIHTSKRSSLLPLRGRAAT